MTVSGHRQDQPTGSYRRVNRIHCQLRARLLLAINDLILIDDAETMILNRFLKPKWQHPNPEVRKQAVQGLAPSDPVLVQVARQDRNPDVRQTAVGQLAEPDLLRQVAEQDADADVRAAAIARLQDLIAGRAATVLPLDRRITCLAEALPVGIAEFIAVQGTEPTLRLAAVERITNETCLANVASADPVANVRLAALERIQQPASLEQVATLTRHRDKRVYRRACERLDSLHTQHERLQRIHQLCVDMEALIWDGETGANAGRFAKLEREWHELEFDAAAEARERYRHARERFLAQRQESAAKRAAKSAVCHSLESFLTTLRNEQELTEVLAGLIADTLRSAQEAWPPEGGAGDLEGQRLTRRRRELIAAIEEQQRLLVRNRQRAERLRELLQEADALRQQTSEVREADLTALEGRWGSLEQPENPSLAAGLQAQFEVALDRLRARIQRQLDRRDQELQEIRDLLAMLQEALQEGRSQQAIDCYEQARDRLNANFSLSRKQMAVLAERLQACMPKINELRGWRRWGAQQAREHLCEAAEGLIGLEDDPKRIAKRIQEVRSAWQALDHKEGAAAKALWKRFDNACERAYQPCQTYFDAQAAERRLHLEQKQAVCERLEQFVATTDWEQVNWREADRLRRRLEEQWRRIGPVNHAHKKDLERRYTAALGQLDAHLDQERERSLQRRRELIQQIKALADSPDLNVAVETVKRLQTEWRPTVQASRREEQALWKQFRAACDAVFERRRGERQAVEQERQANLARKAALCQEIEDLSVDSVEAARQATRRLAEIRQEWATTGFVPKPSAAAIDQRFNTALKDFGDRLRQAESAEAERRRQGWRARDQLCQQMETLLWPADADPAADVAQAITQARQSWAELEPLAGTLAESLQRRFDMACQAAANPDIGRAWRETLQGNLKNKQELCLHMEIIAGVESPPEFAQQRMELQVSRLSASFHGETTARSGRSLAEAAREIQQEWYSMGLWPPAQKAALEARFERALTALP